LAGRPLTLPVLGKQAGPCNSCTSVPKRLEFNEQDEQWSITEFHSDGNSRRGEPFPASGHEHLTRLQQVLTRIASKYPDYRVHPTPYHAVNETHYSLEVLPKQTA